MKKIILSETLEDRTARLSDGINKVKGLYQGLTSWDVSEVKEDNDLLVEIEEENLLYISVEEYDKGLVIKAIYPVDESNQYADTLYTAFIADIQCNEKVYLPNVVYETLDSILTVKVLPFKPYTQGISNDIEGGWLIIRTPKPVLSLKERMLVRRGK